MLQALIGPVSGLIGSWMDKKTEEQRGKSAVAKARAEAEAAVMVSAATSTADWEKLMAKGSQNSWKDEWLTILFSIPLILAFCGDWGRQIVAEGFAALEAMPDYYQYTLGVIVSASFAVRSATKFFGKNNGCSQSCRVSAEGHTSAKSGHDAKAGGWCGRNHSGLPVHGGSNTRLDSM